MQLHMNRSSHTGWYASATLSLYRFLYRATAYTTFVPTLRTSRLRSKMFVHERHVLTLTRRRRAAASQIRRKCTRFHAKNALSSPLCERVRGESARLVKCRLGPNDRTTTKHPLLPGARVRSRTAIRNGNENACT